MSLFVETSAERKKEATRIRIVPMKKEKECIIIKRKGFFIMFLDNIKETTIRSGERKHAVRKFDFAAECAVCVSIGKAERR